MSNNKHGLLIFLLLGLSLVARAEPHGNWEGHGRRDDDRGYEHHHEQRLSPPGWQGEIHQFRDHDEDIWRGGNWRYGHHDGRLGWWWVVAGIWYFYPQRVLPYPDPYQPPLTVQPPLPVAPQYWYYCPNPAGYYPYVARCFSRWERVLAQP